MMARTWFLALGFLCWGGCSSPLDITGPEAPAEDAAPAPEESGPTPSDWLSIHTADEERPRLAELRDAMVAGGMR